MKVEGVTAKDFAKAMQSVARKNPNAFVLIVDAKIGETDEIVITDNGSNILIQGVKDNG